MRFCAFCIIDGPGMSAAIVAHLVRAGFADGEISIASTMSPHSAKTPRERMTRSHEAKSPQPNIACTMTGSPLALIADPGDGTGAETGRLSGGHRRHVMPAGRSADDFRLLVNPGDILQELLQTMPIPQPAGTASVSVRTCNSYEIETILEIFREHGACQCTYIVDRKWQDKQQTPASAASLVHDHTTILKDRLRESA